MKKISPLKRIIVSTMLFLLLAVGASASAEQLPIVFVHGTGDYAALWTTTIWRFETNGYDPDLLFAVNMVHPIAAGEDTKPAENQSTTVDQASQLDSLVTRTLLTTGKDKVILVGHEKMHSSRSFNQKCINS